MHRTLRSTLIVSIVGIAIAAALSLALLAVAQLWPHASTTRIQWGDHSTALSGVFDSGAFDFMIAWAAITWAILISVAAIIFVFTIAAIALGTVALFMALPMMLIGACVWWAVRRNRRAPLLHGGTPSPQA